MKNPFVQMAVIAAAMVAAFAEKMQREQGEFSPTPSHRGHPGSKRGAMHVRNPPGSKFIRRAYKAKTGLRGTYAEAADWYNSYEPQAKRVAAQKGAE